MLEVDKKHLHEVRRQIEAMALRIYCAKISGNTDGVSGSALSKSIEDALTLRKGIDEAIKEKVVTPTGDIDKQLGGTTV
jgi:hypothetical protein